MNEQLFAMFLRPVLVEVFLLIVLGPTVIAFELLGRLPTRLQITPLLMPYEGSGMGEGGSTVLAGN